MKFISICRSLFKLLPSLQTDLNNTEKVLKNVISGADKYYEEVKNKFENWLKISRDQEVAKVVGCLGSSLIMSYLFVFVTVWRLVVVEILLWWLSI